MMKTRSKRRTTVETRRRKVTVVIANGVNKEVVVETERNAAIKVVDAVVVAVATEKTKTQKWMTIVLFMVGISGANATRILAETITILQEEVAKMDEDVVISIQAALNMVEVAEAIGTTTTTTTILEMNIAAWMVCRNKELQTTAKESTSRMLKSIIQM
jgi:hypothetical protein